MSIDLLNKIKSDVKMYNYLKNNSRWYIILNRNEESYNKFYKEYKKFLHDNTLNNIDNMIDNVDLISTILKIS